MISVPARAPIARDHARQGFARFAFRSSAPLAALVCACATPGATTVTATASASSRRPRLREPEQRQRGRAEHQQQRQRPRADGRGNLGRVPRAAEGAGGARLVRRDPRRDLAGRAPLSGARDLFSKESLAVLDRELQRKDIDSDHLLALRFLRRTLAGESLGLAVAPFDDTYSDAEAAATAALPFLKEPVPYRNLGLLIAAESDPARRAQLYAASTKVLEETLNPILARKEAAAQKAAREAGFSDYVALSEELRPGRSARALERRRRLLAGDRCALREDARIGWRARSWTRRARSCASRTWGASGRPPSWRRCSTRSWSSGRWISSSATSARISRRSRAARCRSTTASIPRSGRARSCSRSESARGRAPLGQAHRRPRRRLDAVPRGGPRGALRLDHGDAVGERPARLRRAHRGVRRVLPPRLQRQALPGPLPRVPARERQARTQQRPARRGAAPHGADRDGLPAPLRLRQDRL